jgi:uncharacterized protein YndB with AHSA1/START domain
MEPMTAAPTIHRRVDLDADRNQAWSLLADADGLAGWLAESVELDAVSAGVAGRVIELDGTIRRLVVTEVLEGERLSFAWWSEDDPTDASSVVVTIDGDERGGSVAISIVETLDPGAAAIAGAFGHRADACGLADVADLAAVDDAWGERLARLTTRVSRTLV